MLMFFSTNPLHCPILPSKRKKNSKVIERKGPSNQIHFLQNEVLCINRDPSKINATLISIAMSPEALQNFHNLYFIALIDFTSPWATNSTSFANIISTILNLLNFRWEMKFSPISENHLFKYSMHREKRKGYMSTINHNCT